MEGGREVEEKCEVPPSKKKKKERRKDRWVEVHVALRKDSTEELGLPSKIKSSFPTSKSMEKANGEVSPRELVNELLLYYFLFLSV